ncbi:flagellar protein FlaG [Fervidobacterium thailandense]|uniref:flagellar protein FlaG n=1 Tax=Fervidobacterium thailandense TaxID=1008305 RepID=UPI000846225B|nr:flagellar protein FlaG [Fervidobacterium thailandense]
MDGVKGVTKNGEIVQLQRNVNPSTQPSDQLNVGAVMLKEDKGEHHKNSLIDVEKGVDLLKETFEKLKKIFRGQAEFKIDREANMIIIRIKDPETGEILRQIPPEQAVKLAKNIQELLGVLMDERV